MKKILSGTKAALAAFLALALMTAFFAGCANPAGGDSPPPVTPPARSTSPENIRVYPANTQLTVAWDAVENAGTYAVYCRTTNTLDKSGAKNITSDTVTAFSGLTNGTTYYIWVEAVGTGGVTGPVSVKPAPAARAPNVPTVNMAALDGEIVIGIKRVSYSDGAPPTGYVVRLGETEDISAAEEITVTIPLYRRTGLTNGKPYYIWVKATNEIGESDFSVLYSAVPSATSTFDSFENFSNWLTAQPANTAATSYPVKIAGINIGDLKSGTDPLGLLFATLKNKYVALDLSECTCTYEDCEEGVIPNLVNSPSAGRSNYGLGLVSLVFPEDVRVIGSYLLAGSGIVSVVWPPELESIGVQAFSACSLVSVEFPEGIESIGNNAFYSCNSLASVKFPAGATSIGGEGVFSLCRFLVSVEFPEGFESIDNNTFQNCTSLVSVELPEGLKSIGTSAFSYCTSLVLEKLPQGLESIGDSAFNGCTSLVLVELPVGLEFIGSTAFNGCSSFVSVELPEGLEFIGNSIFGNCTSLASVKLPQGLTSIGNQTFYGCGSLASIKLPTGLESIGNNAFQNCTSLVSVELPAELESIGTYAFSGCSSLVSVSAALPAGLTTVPAYGFQNCVSLASITLPDSVTSIGANAFVGCTALASIRLSKNMETYTAGALPANNKILVMDIADDAPHFGVLAAGKILVNKDTETLIVYIGAVGNITIPGGITSIGAGVFTNNLDITGVTIPEGVTSIGDYTFDSCTNLKMLTLPSTGLTSIDSSAFNRCTALESVTLPGSLAGASAIGAHAFRDTGLKNVTVEEGVTHISDYMFYGCSADRIDLPSTITSIGTYGICRTSSPSVSVILIVRALTPPDLGTNYSLSNIISSGVIGMIYVPDESVTAYSESGTAAYGWKSYYDAGKIVGLSTLPATD